MSSFDRDQVFIWMTAKEQAPAPDLYESAIATGMISSLHAQHVPGSWPVVWQQGVGQTADFNPDDFAATIASMEAWLSNRLGKRLSLWARSFSPQLCATSCDWNPGHTFTYLVKFPERVDPREMVDQGLFAQAKIQATPMCVSEPYTQHRALVAHVPIDLGRQHDLQMAKVQQR
ncbi:hypothetical protein BJX70DRAFT_395350 [Aspergillus crustosus]